MKSPFDLPGPEFLLFFAIFGVAVLFFQRWLQNMIEPGSQNGSPGLADDPYAIAYLRGGPYQAIFICIIALIDRGLLKASDDKIVMPNAEALAFLKRPIEQSVAAKFRCPTQASTFFSSFSTEDLKETCKEYDQAFKKAGFLPTIPVYISRWMVLAVTMAILLGAGFHKISIALSRGKHNIGFLCILMSVFLVISLIRVVRKRTGAGDLELNRLRDQFVQLKARASTLQSGGKSNEAALAAALWGSSVLPDGQFPYVKSMFPQKSSGSYNGWEFSCDGGGGGCGGGGGGGGCGGGGCGGGCGGCS